MIMPIRMCANPTPVFLPIICSSSACSAQPVKEPPRRLRLCSGDSHQAIAECGAEPSRISAILASNTERLPPSLRMNAMIPSKQLGNNAKQLQGDQGNGHAFGSPSREMFGKEWKGVQKSFI